MSKRAEEKAVEYQIKTHGPNVMGGASMLSEEEYIIFNMNQDFKNGYEQAEKDLGWHSVDECLPEIDAEEVIVLRDVHGTAPIYNVGVAHIVDRRYAMDFNGWNSPGVRYWMPFPKVPEETWLCARLAAKRLNNMNLGVHFYGNLFPYLRKRGKLDGLCELGRQGARPVWLYDTDGIAHLVKSGELDYNPHD